MTTTLLEQSLEFLPSQGFLVRRIDRHPEWLVFEDAAVAGVVVEFQTVAALLSGWDKAQSAYLSWGQSRLRKAPDKAWNLYTVLLTAESDPTLDQQALSLEEDFVSTRKLVGTGIVNITDLVRVLLPLLPLQNLVFAKDDDARAILGARLTMREDVIDRLLSGCSPNELARILKEAS